MPSLPKLAVLVPLYKRVERLPELAANLAETTPSATLYLRACKETPKFKLAPNMRVIVSENTRYPHGINLLARKARKHGFPWLFIGADDLHFHEDWYEKALAHAEPNIEAIGTNDLSNPHVMAGRHATHFLVRSGYEAIDDPEQVMPEVYNYLFVDNELVESASARGIYAFAKDSHVEHLHPAFGKGMPDETYQRGSSNMERDGTIFLARRRLWR